MIEELNQRAARCCEPLLSDPQRYGVRVATDDSGATIVDCGVHAPGGLQTGVILAETCLAGLAQVRLAPKRTEDLAGPCVTVNSDHPLLACIGSQYAGRRIAVGDFFAMGSGPFRALWPGEAVLEEHGLQATARGVAVAVLETSQLPAADVCRHIAAGCSVPPESLTVLCARTASLAGGLQIAARSLETALHKMHELGLSLDAVDAGWGAAPLPPLAANDLQALGWTNDAILYGGRVRVWGAWSEDELAEKASQIPSSASRDYGRPFGDVFESCGRDFYKIDPLLFSPAEIVLENRRGGRIHRHGRLASDVLRQSFSA